MKHAPTLTLELAWRAAWDAGAASARAAKRQRWAYDDFCAAVREWERLEPMVQRDAHTTV